MLHVVREWALAHVSAVFSETSVEIRQKMRPRDFKMHYNMYCLSIQVKQGGWEGSFRNYSHCLF